MLKRFASFVLCSLTSAALAQPGVMPTVQAAKAGENPSVRMQEFIASAIAQQHFTGSVLVVKDDTILVDEGFGAADLEWKVPNSPATKFRLGSLTKQFTAAGFLLLEERGKLKLTDPVSKYMPNSPAGWAGITLYQVLTHTSGIPGFTEFPDYQTTEWKDTTPVELVARFKDKPLDFAPGSKFSYSNSGYVLLGYLLEQITGQKYGDFLQANIFTPLGMVDTGMDDNKMILPNRAQGYKYGSHGFEHADYISMTIPFSAGALYSTTGDLLKWELGLFGGKLLKPESLKKMLTPNLETYALGVGVAVNQGHRVVSHSGGIEGFSTFLAEAPEDHLTVIALTNSENDKSGLLGTQLMKVALGMPVDLPVAPSARREVAVDPSALAELPGSYRVAPTFALVITLENGQLMAEATGQQKFPLFAESPTRFFFKVVDAQVDFNRDPASGKVTSLTLHQGGRDVPAKRE